MKTLNIIITLVIGLSVSYGVTADGHKKSEGTPFKKEIKARMAVMDLYAYYLGELGAMAKGKVPYDAEAASRAAKNLLAAASLNNTSMWPQGSDNSVPALKNKTRAKPETWTTFPEVVNKQKALVAAATTMAAEAGNGLDAIRANMGGVGKACKDCHKAFRGPELEGHHH